MKVAIDSGSLTSGHSVRGIGVMVGEQIEAIKRLRDKEIKLDPFDFQSEDGRQKLEDGKYDVVHYPYFFPYALTLPVEKMGKKMVVTIQDLIQLVYPKNYPPGIRGKINFFKQKKRLKNVDAVVTISETSKKDIVRFLGIPPGKIFVIALSAKEIFKTVEDAKKLKLIARRHHLPNKFVLYVGDVNYNKNILGLIEACKIAEVDLVICGKQALEIEELGKSLYELQGPRDYYRFLFNIPHPELVHYQSLLDEFKNNAKILRLGFVSDDDLVAIYNLTTVYVQPCFYEGFGLPVLEAFVCGCPVIVARTSALTEVANGVALVADPKNPSDIAERIKEVFDNAGLRAKLIREGKKRAREFSWERTAKEMLKIYKLVAGS